MAKAIGEDGPKGTLPAPLRRRCAMRRDDDGSAGVVSILLAILVIITLLTVVTTIWMPEWNEDIESNHMKQVGNEFSVLKSNIDKQILSGESHFIIGNSITLGSQGFSVFGSDSAGTFSINHFRDSDLEYMCNVRSGDDTVDVTATGGLKYESANVNFIDQELAYQNGAVILSQGGTSEMVRFSPQFSVERHGPINRISFVLITVSGVESVITGTGTVLVQTQLITYTSKEHTFQNPEWLYITMFTEFTQAWSSYFTTLLIEEGLTGGGVDFDITITDDKLVLSIRDVQFFNMGFALMDVQLEENSGGVADGPSVDGLVGLWHFNEDAGALGRDSSIVHNDANLFESTWTPGVRGSGLAFDGVDDYALAPEIPEYNMQMGLTVAAWVRWDENPWDGTPWAAIVSKHENQWMLHHSGDAVGTTHTNDAFEFALRTDEGREYVWSSTVPAANQWYFVVGTWSNATGMLNIYINGTLEDSTALNGTIDLRVNDLTFGTRYNSGAYDRHLEGTIDEVMLFDRALTEQEVLRYYQSLKP